MKRKLIMLLVMVLCLTSFTVPAYANDDYITSYAFAGVAGSISGTAITVNIPYSKSATYWDHIVEVSEGAYFTAGAITKIDEQHYRGQITVTGKSGSKRTYTVNINKNDFQPPTYEIAKAKSIKKDGAKIVVTYNKNDAVVKYVRLMFYTGKNPSSPSYRPVNGEGEVEVELTGLQQDTKYYYYLEIQTDDKTYTTSTKNFTTKKSSDTGTASSSSNNSTSKNNTTTTPSKGTNSSGPGTEAKQDETVKNQWKLVDNKWYYFGADGFSKVGWFEVGGKWYYVTKGTNELAMSQWKEIGNIWYYFDASGAMLANQWLNSGGKWYYLGASGSMVRNQEINIGGVTYLMNPDGTCADHTWVMKNGNWQYYKAGAMGLAKNESFTYNGATYYADANGYVK